MSPKPEAPRPAAMKSAEDDDFDVVFDELQAAEDDVLADLDLDTDLRSPASPTPPRASDTADLTRAAQAARPPAPAQGSAPATKKPGTAAPTTRPAATQPAAPGKAAGTAHAGAAAAAPSAKPPAARTAVPVKSTETKKPATTAPRAAAAPVSPAAGARRATVTPDDLPPLPAQVGYELLPAEDGIGPASLDHGFDLVAVTLPGAVGAPAAPTPATESAPTPVAASPAPAATARGNRRRLLLILALGGGLLALGAAVYSFLLPRDGASSQTLSQYEQIRARAAQRAQARPAPVTESARAEAGGGTGTSDSPADAAASAPKEAGAPAGPASGALELGIAYGTEKRNWLEWATQQFADTEDGRRIRVNLIPMGSLESAHAILGNDQRIHVWSPASGLYREVLVRDWGAQHSGQPILKEEALALTPMVLVMWKQRYQAFVLRSPVVSLRTICSAMHAPKGWGTIAGKPEWGRFKFGHTHPNQSNSGLMTLVLLAYEFHDKTSGLTVGDIMVPEFQEYLTRFGTGVTGLSHSTGTMMKEMTLKGPTSYDALFVYESVAIDYLESAKGRWDELQIVYPQCNLWNDNPYCILNTPWTTPEHQQAAATFLKFLMSEPIQARALAHGFRPGNPDVPVKGPDSPFVRFADSGLRVEIPSVCEVPSLDVMHNLQQAWVRHAQPPTRGRR